METRGIGVMSGKSGTGKSCVLRLLIDRLQPGLYKSYYLCHTSVAIVEFYTDSLNALTVLLCGNEHLPRRFGLSVLEPLASVITISIPVEALPKEETFAYIESRLTDAGAQAPLATKNALELIHQASAGVMRAVGTITTAAMHRAFMTKSAQVEAEHVQAVLQR